MPATETRDTLHWLAGLCRASCARTRPVSWVCAECGHAWHDVECEEPLEDSYTPGCRLELCGCWEAVAEDDDD